MSNRCARGPTRGQLPIYLKVLQKTKDVLKVVALLVGCVLAAWLMWRFTPRSSAAVTQPTNAELVSVILTGVTIVLAVLAIVIAILAVWGYQGIKGEAVAAAERASARAVERRIAEQITEAKIADAIAKGVREQLRGMSVNASIYPDAFRSEALNQTTQGTVGKEYPEGDGDTRRSGPQIPPSPPDNDPG